MSKKFTSIEETNETVAILEQKPEIDRKVNYFKEVMIGLDGVIDAINKRIERGYTIETFKILWIPINKRIILDDYDKSKLIIEKHRVELEIFEKKNYYDRWMERKNQYDQKFKQVEMDCDVNYDNIFTLAKEVANYNIRLAQTMRDYNNESNDKKMKVEYYLYMKQEVENAIKAGKLKTTKVEAPQPQPQPQPQIQ